MTGRWAHIGGALRDLRRQRPAFAHLDVTDFGVAPINTATTNQTGLVTALGEADSQNLPLYVPPGAYLHSGRLPVASAVLFGIATRETVLLGTTVDTHAVDLTGTSPGLHNLTVRGPSKYPRSSDRGGNGVYVNAATGYTVRNCLILDVPGAGIMVENGTTGLVRNCLITATGADGILHAEGSSGVEIAYNRTVVTGDDAIAVTSYNTTAGFCSNFDVHHNSVLGNWESRAISVNGTSGGITVRDNHIDGGTSGVSVTSVAAWGTKQSTGVGVYGNTIRGINHVRQDTGTIGGGALHLYNDLGGTDSSIAMHDNQVHDPRLHGMYVAGSSAITASFTTNAFYIAAGVTNYLSDNGSASITQTGNTTGLPSTYPGDLVARSVGGLDPAYLYVP